MESKLVQTEFQWLNSKWIIHVHEHRLQARDCGTIQRTLAKPYSVAPITRAKYCEKKKEKIYKKLARREVLVKKFVKEI